MANWMLPLMKKYGEQSASKPALEFGQGKSTTQQLNKEITRDYADNLTSYGLNYYPSDVDNKYTGEFVMIRPNLASEHKPVMSFKRYIDKLWDLRSSSSPRSAAPTTLRDLTRNNAEHGSWHNTNVYLRAIDKHNQHDIDDYIRGMKSVHGVGRDIYPGESGITPVRPYQSLDFIFPNRASAKAPLIETPTPTNSATTNYLTPALLGLGAAGLGYGAYRYLHSGKKKKKNVSEQ